MLNLKFPEVRRFMRAALAHRDAARGLLGLCPPKGKSTRGHAVVYLCGYVVECSLKALLINHHPERKHGEVVAKFKDTLKHNLELIRSELIKKGTNFSKEQQENFKRVRRNWSSEMRYKNGAVASG
jgi:hypothetical protein